MRQRRAGIDFMSKAFRQPKGQGGARVNVEAKSLMAQESTAPMNAARIYQSPSVRSFDQSDPRYDGKSDQVENIYLAAPEAVNKPRSGIAQILNWLTTGRLS